MDSKGLQASITARELKPPEPSAGPMGSSLVFMLRVIIWIEVSGSDRVQRAHKTWKVLVGSMSSSDQTGTYRGNPPSNKHFEVPWVQFLLFRGEQIYEVHDYYDRLDLLRQIGVINLDFAGLPIADTEGTYEAGPTLNT